MKTILFTSLCLGWFGCSSSGGNDLSVPDAAVDLAVEPPDLVGADLTGLCPDEDGDGRSAAPGCGEVDCDDHNPNVWGQCASCVDVDGDGHFVGCDAYVTVRADCDDGNPAVGSHPEILGDGVDQDCDGPEPTAADRRIIYVSATTGSDAAPGTMAMPVQSLDHAIDLAVASKVGTVAVRRFLFIAAGDYTIGSTLLDGGISLYGGYDPGTWATSAQQTNITGTSDIGFHLASNTDGNTLQKLHFTGPSSTAVAAGGAAAVVDCQLVAGTGMFSIGVNSTNSALTVLRSTVQAGPGAYVDGIAAGAADVHIVDSTVTTHGDGTTNGGRSHAIGYGGAATDTLTVSGSTISAADAHDVAGIAMRSTSPGPLVVLTNNTITADAGTSSAPAQLAGISGYGTKHTAIGNRIVAIGSTNMRGYALYNNAQRAILVGNTVRVTGTGTNQLGIMVYNSAADLINNTVRIPDGAGGYAVQVTGAGSRLYNNLLVAGTGTSGTALGITTPSATATTTVVDNALFGQTCTFEAAGTCAAATVNNCTWLGCLVASGSLTGDCGIGATDFHLPTTSACKSAGTDPSAVYATPFVDLDGMTRPQGSWDIGADEIPN